MADTDKWKRDEVSKWISDGGRIWVSDRQVVWISDRGVTSGGGGLSLKMGTGVPIQPQK
jgi:hypothetical protein